MPSTNKPSWIDGLGPQLRRKTWGRIWVREESDIDAVREIIREVDACEFDYMPGDFIAVWPDDPAQAKLVYGHASAEDPGSNDWGLEHARAIVSNALGGLPDFDGFAESLRERASFLRQLHRENSADARDAANEASRLDELAEQVLGVGRRGGYTGSR